MSLKSGWIKNDHKIFYCDIVFQSRLSCFFVNSVAMSKYKITMDFSDNVQYCR